ncbi:unnamed protein product [Lepeophtheirus salmonis]|uniref:(salmon louse) hypothetical protein n=1 Tax=Lepeophtheirus salmonis TaxID=72036 RepID=A0A7R8H2D8_LEPSM|nr:unnamed protein product [Lepeophtheirus salmonis]CAF2812121.1 unnamed protein product [Lepeophtheirus salmonis]
MNIAPGVTASRVKNGMNMDPLRTGGGGNPMISNRRPGQVPPFAVFSQEKRGKLQEMHPEYNFGELGRRLSEMWHSLCEEEKEHYRKKARMIGAQKLKAWDDKMKRGNMQLPYFIQQKSPQAIAPRPPPQLSSAPNAGMNSSSGASGKSGKKHCTVNVPLGDVTRRVAEAWRSLDPPVRATYEAKANRINAIENRRYQQALLVQQRAALAAKARVAQPPSPHQQPLRIASVESLSARPPVKPNVNLPSGITISRVEPESHSSDNNNKSVKASVPRMMPRAPMMNQNVNGGAGLIDMRGGAGGMRGNSVQVAPKMMSMGGGRVSHYPPPLQRRPMMNGGIMPMSYALPGSAGMPMKRILPHNSAAISAAQPLAKRAKQHIIPPRPPLMRQGIKPAPPSPSSIGILGTLDSWEKMCRLCGRTLIPIVPICDDTQILEKVRDYLGINLNLENDKVRGYPPGICRKCSGMLNGFDRFKKVVSQGQCHLNELAKMKRERMGLERKTTEIITYDGGESILPDLDIEIEDHVPRPMLPGDSVNDDESMSSRSSMIESNGKDHDRESFEEEDDIDPDFDPLNFLQVSDVVGDYEESSPSNSKDERDDEEELNDKSDSDPQPEKCSDDIEIANAIYESLLDQSAEEEESNGDDSVEKETSQFESSIVISEEDDNANDCVKEDDHVSIDGNSKITHHSKHGSGANSRNGESSSPKIPSVDTVQNCDLDQSNGSESDGVPKFAEGENSVVSNEEDTEESQKDSAMIEEDPGDRSFEEIDPEELLSTDNNNDNFEPNGEHKSLEGEDTPVYNEESKNTSSSSSTSNKGQIQNMIDEEEKYIENEMDEESIVAKRDLNGGSTKGSNGAVKSTIATATAVGDVIENEFVEASSDSGGAVAANYEGGDEEDEEDPFPEPPTHVDFEDFMEDEANNPISDFRVEERACANLKTVKNNI